MLRSRGTRFALSVLALTAGTALAASTTAVAAPAPKPQESATVPLVPEGVPVDALAALAPAIVGAAAQAGNIASPGQQTILDQAQALLDSAGLPPQIKKTLQAIIAFLSGSNGGGPDIPKNGPAIAQFLYPSIGKGCIGAGADSVGTALAVPGPAELPPPGPGANQAGFVFTALGTKGLTPQQNPPMTVQWLNIDTQQGGVLPLTDEAHINPDGPATLTAIANTGPGRVVAVVSGSLTTQPKPDQPPITCSFLPTLGFFTVAPTPTR
ncbi:hypothetical protein NDR87_17300 [Nocardia sp. CDC159]|uniref:Secreted protein n=1 Tax=Nocardia pulmonis TaxID=2951408 RepID=A0A9X2E854_9NOCA|nr:MULTISPECIES: hypothetical protein [Nocardia]MCM6775907.1 hypothetical protein [Nocardia pulmonis]MCM6788117.1 hypothetical protein [Nocardia sp. CDC159]